MKKLTPPLFDADIGSLRAGDEVLVSGVLYGARDMAHKRLCELLDGGEELPFPLAGAIIYFVGPTPGRPGQVIGAAGPTTSSRMDSFSPKLIAGGLKAMIGKGYRGQEVRDALKEHCAVHLATEVIAFEELGTEAVRKLDVVDFPAIVAYDFFGNSVYDK